MYAYSEAPWYVESGMIVNDEFEIFYPADCINGMEKECMASNMKLAAAAPDLLEALQDLFGADMEYCMKMDGKEDQLAAIAKARAAIAKATGETK